jgi:hypothetical protein
VLRGIGKIVRLTGQRIRVQGEGFRQGHLDFLRTTLLSTVAPGFRAKRRRDRGGAFYRSRSIELLGGFGSSINRAFCKIGKLFICAFFFGEGGVEERHGLVEAKFLRPGL